MAGDEFLGCSRLLQRVEFLAIEQSRKPAELPIRIDG